MSFVPTTTTESVDRVLDEYEVHLYECNSCGHQLEKSTDLYDDGERRQCTECLYLADHHYLGVREVTVYVDDDHPGYLSCERHGQYRADERMCPDCYDIMKAVNGA